MTAADRARPLPFGWRFIDLALLGVNSPRSYLLTGLRVVVIPPVFLAVVFAALYSAAAAHLLGQAATLNLVVLTAFGAVISAGIALAWGVSRSHRRPWMSLISADLVFDWRRFGIGAAVQGGLLLLATCLVHVLLGKPWPPGPSLKAPVFAAVMLLVPFQAASEEMLFRGYLTQSLGRVLRSRWLTAAIVGVAFGALHFNAYGRLTLPYLCVLSLVYSLVSLRDERLELTIGAHAMTNWAAIGAADALHHGVTGIQLDWPAVGGLAANGILFYLITRLLVVRLCGRGRAG